MPESAKAQGAEEDGMAVEQQQQQQQQEEEEAKAKDLIAEAAVPQPEQHEAEPVVGWRSWAVTQLALALFMSRALGEVLGGLVAAPFRSLAERPALVYKPTHANTFLVDRCPALQSFRAAPWAPGPMSQTVLGLALNSGCERYQRRELVQVADGVELLLDTKEPPEEEGGQPLPDDTPVLLLLHGIGGGSDSRLSCLLSDVARSHGWRCVVFNRRGHGQSSVLPGPQAPLLPHGTPPPPGTPRAGGRGPHLPFLRHLAGTFASPPDGKAAAAQGKGVGASTFKVTAAAATAAATIKGMLLPTRSSRNDGAAAVAPPPPTAAALGAAAPPPPAPALIQTAVDVGAAATSVLPGPPAPTAGGEGPAALEPDHVSVTVAAAGALSVQPGNAAQPVEVEVQEGVDEEELEPPERPESQPLLSPTNRPQGAATPHLEAGVEGAAPGGALPVLAGGVSAIAANAGAAHMPSRGRYHATGRITVAGFTTTWYTGTFRASSKRRRSGVLAQGSNGGGGPRSPSPGPGSAAGTPRAGGGAERGALGGAAAGGEVQAQEEEDEEELEEGRAAKVPRSEASLLKQVSRVFPKHSDTDDLAAVVEFLHAEYPHAPLVALGFSQGSNVLTQFVGQQCAAGRPPPFVAAMSVSNAFDLSAGTKQLDWVTDAVITRPIKRLLQKELTAVRRLARVHGLQLDLRGAVNACSIRQFDEALVVKALGYDDVEDYYQAQSSRDALKDVRIPMLFLNNSDDPIIKDKLPLLAEEAARDNDCIIAARTRRGGHLGWLQGWQGRAWLGEVMMEFAKAAVEGAKQGLLPAPWQP